MNGLESDQLPSYSEATSRDHWRLIAPYVASSDLYSSSLVCKRWHGFFAPQLWGSPASHFETENDAVYVALTRFRRVLSWARPHVCCLTHTLHIPPAHAETYGGPHDEWLRDMLRRLPGLQCLIVQSLPFFDHGCLMALSPSLNVDERFMSIGLGSNLRLLDASSCRNATWSGLATALRQFPSLLWLDLSGTPAAAHSNVLQNLDCMNELQSLKLCNIGLNDVAFAVLAGAIGLKVRSLDVSGNVLTDVSAHKMVVSCFRRDEPDGPASWRSRTLGAFGGSMPGWDGGEAFNTHLHDRLIRDFADRLVVQDDSEPGLTHLYISNNDFTVAGVSDLLLTGKLECLDAGSIVGSISHSDASTTSDAPSSVESTALGAEALVNDFKQIPLKALTYLRIHHHFVTKAVLQPRRGINEGVDLAGSTSTAESQSSVKLNRPRAIRTKGVIHDLKCDFGCDDDLKESNDSCEYAAAIESSASTDSEGSTSARAPLHWQMRRLSSMKRARSMRAAYQRGNVQHFVPLLAPQLRTLVLCGVPEKTSDRSVPDRIIRLIEACAREHDLALAEARLDYTCPPGRDRSDFVQQYRRSIFALDRIVLEMADPSEPEVKLKASTDWRQQPTSKTMIEDMDIEALWNAGSQDFSFFDSEKHNPKLKSSSSTQSGLVDSPSTDVEPERRAQGHPTRANYSSETNSLSMVDVIAEIVSFRSERKAAKQARVSAGFPQEAVAGFWEGTVQVARPYRSG